MAELQPKTYYRIVDTFLEFYKHKPLSEIYVSEICKNCGISRGTFYYYFSDVYDLCEKLEHKIIEEMEADLTIPIMYAVGHNKSRNDPRWIKAYSECLKKYILKKELYQCLLTGSHGIAFHRMWTASASEKFAVTLQFADVNNKTVPVICRFFGGGLVTVLANWLNCGCIESPEDIATAVNQVLFLGALSVCGE